MHEKNYYSSPQKHTKKAVLTIFTNWNPTPLSLFSSYPKFWDSFEIFETRKRKSLNHDKPGKRPLLWNGYMRTKILIEILSYDNFLSIVWNLLLNQTQIYQHHVETNLVRIFFKLEAWHVLLLIIRRGHTWINNTWMAPSSMS